MDDETIYIAMLSSGTTIAGVPINEDNWKEPFVVVLNQHGDLRMDILNQFNKDLDTIKINKNCINYMYPAEEKFCEIYKEHRQKMKALKSGIHTPSSQLSRPSGNRGGRKQ